MCDLKNIGADGIFRGHAQRHYDFRSGVKLDKKDHIANWRKPTKPEWMSIIREETSAPSSPTMSV